MIVVGGTYLEVCLRPEWRRLFGSGLRAACAVAELSPGTVVHTYGFEEWKKDIEYSAAALQCEAKVTSIKDAISFSYDHPLSSAIQHPQSPKQNSSLRVSGDTVLRFGFVEGDAIVAAEYAVYDPQFCDPAVSFRSNGSVAKHLAVVLSEEEAAALGHDNRPAIQALMEHHGAEVIVLKCGPRGAIVHVREGNTTEIHPYWSNSVFKIGSGDVFSAAFALYWGERRINPATAADLASRSVAQFVDGHNLPLHEASYDKDRSAVMPATNNKIYLAGPFFDLAQRWMIEETLQTLKRLGATVFSPLHEVGTQQSSVEIAHADLRGLVACSKVLALLDGMDPGTIFEVGYARALNIPVVALVERFEPEHLTMFEGSGCEIMHDFTTAIYRTIWTKGQ